MNYEGRKQVLLRVRRQYFDMIVSGEKKEELRADKPIWAWLLGDDPPDVARFTCGKDTHLRKIKRIFRASPEVILGRPPSAQGRKDLGLPPESKRKFSRPVIVIELDFTMGLCPSCGGLMWRGFKDHEEGVADDNLDWFGCDQCERIFNIQPVSRRMKK